MFRGRPVPAELAALHDLKRAGSGGDVDFGYWDFRYFMNVDMERRCDVDMEAIKQYFPLEVGAGGTGPVGHAPHPELTVHVAHGAPVAPHGAPVAPHGAPVAPHGAPVAPSRCRPGLPLRLFPWAPTMGPLHAADGDCEHVRHVRAPAWPAV
jgi:hypothetical protein